MIEEKMKKFYEHGRAHLHIVPLSTLYAMKATAWLCCKLKCKSRKWCDEYKKVDIWIKKAKNGIIL